MSFTFAQVFLAALCFYFVVHSLTCLAEIIHLKRTVGEVPAPLKEKISPAQHRKAASYDIARTKLSWLEVTVSTALIVVLTAGDGINTISDWLMDHVGDQFAFHWMLPAIVGLIFVVVDLPFCWYREFRLTATRGKTRKNGSRILSRLRCSVGSPSCRYCGSAYFCGKKPDRTGGFGAGSVFPSI